MKLYSTKNKSRYVSLKEAVMKGLPEDNGLYMPETIPQLPESFFTALRQMKLPDIGYEVSKALFQGEIPDSELRNIVTKALTFPAPLVKLNESTYILELFHGPSLAFKDFGARFMAQLMSYFNRNEDKELTILVATSGDTGGAVAAGFHNTPGINVVILYPSGKVSELQEKQLTTLGGNVKALEVLGTFDDCQALVKQAFLDKELNQNLRLSSANSINIARLIPQSFYYFEAWKQLPEGTRPVFVVPSGNFGNLTAGVLAKRMGLPVEHFVAATNVNDVVPEYVKTGKYTPRPSVQTISNAMDVGNPSNFERLQDIFSFTWNRFVDEISAYSLNDEETRAQMRECYESYSYILDPHGSVGYGAWKRYTRENDSSVGVILETAHPSKFIDEVESTLKTEVEIPDRLANLRERTKKAVQMTPTFKNLKDYLLGSH
jgi:threonine synthase